MRQRGLRCRTLLRAPEERCDGLPNGASFLLVEMDVARLHVIVSGFCLLEVAMDMWLRVSRGWCGGTRRHPDGLCAGKKPVEASVVLSNSLTMLLFCPVDLAAVPF